MDITIRVIVVGRGGLKWATIANFEQVQTEFGIKFCRQIGNRYQICIKHKLYCNFQVKLYDKFFDLAYTEPPIPQI